MHSMSSPHRIKTIVYTTSHNQNLSETTNQPADNYFQPLLSNSNPDICNFLSAVYFGDYILFDTYIQSGIDVNIFSSIQIDPFNHVSVNPLMVLACSDQNYSNRVIEISGMTIIEYIFRRLLQSNIDINARNVYGESALYLSIYFENNTLTRLLLSLKSISVENHMSIAYNKVLSPLYSAVLRNNVHIAQFLISLQADMDILYEGRSLLYHACSLGLFDMVKVLMNAEYDTTYKDNDGRTALFIASQHNHIHIVKFMLDIGCHIVDKSGARLDLRISRVKKALDINQIDENDNTMLSTAIMNGNLKLVGLLLCYNDLDIDHNSNIYKYSPLHLACYSHNINMVKILLSPRAIDANTYFEQLFDNSNVVEILSQGSLKEVIKQSRHDEHTPTLINLNSRDDSDCTPFQVCCVFGYHELASLILSYSQQVCNSYSSQYCCSGDNDDEFEDYEDYNEGKHTTLVMNQFSITYVDINQGCHLMSSPLHYAAFHGHTELARVLIDYGANIYLLNTENRTSLDCACMQGAADIVDKIVSHHEYKQEELRQIRLSGNLDGVTNINTDLISNVDSGGLTPLHHILRFYKRLLISTPKVCETDIENCHCVRIVDCLLNADSTLRSVTNPSSTALFLAVNTNNEVMLPRLLRRFGGINDTYMPGYTLLTHAIRNQQHTAIRILLEHGAAVNYFDFEGSTPLRRSLDMRDYNMVHLILTAKPNVHMALTILPNQSRSKHPYRASRNKDSQAHTRQVSLDALVMPNSFSNFSNYLSNSLSNGTLSLIDSSNVNSNIPGTLSNVSDLSLISSNNINIHSFFPSNGSPNMELHNPSFLPPRSGQVAQAQSSNMSYRTLTTAPAVSCNYKYHLLFEELGILRQHRLQRLLQIYLDNNCCLPSFYRHCDEDNVEDTQNVSKCCEYEDDEEPFHNNRFLNMSRNGIFSSSPLSIAPESHTMSDIGLYACTTDKVSDGQASVYYNTIEQDVDHLNLVFCSNQQVYRKHPNTTQQNGSDFISPRIRNSQNVILSGSFSNNTPPSLSSHLNPHESSEGQF